MSKSSSVCKAGHAKGPGRCHECRRVYQASYHQKNNESILKRKAKYRKSNPERFVISSAKYRARKQELSGFVSGDIIDKLKVLQKGRCPCCGEKLGTDYHLDHIMPLSRGGRHEDTNLQLLKSSCNLTKRAKHPSSFMREKGFLI